MNPNLDPEILHNFDAPFPHLRSHPRLQEGYLDLRAAAEQARRPVAVLLEEMASRKVAVLEQPDAFGPGLETLRAAFSAEDS